MRRGAENLQGGEIIFHDGDKADCLYIVKEGQVDIALGNRLLRPLGAGEIFGEMAIIDGSPRSASATARTDVTLIPADEKQFVFLVGQLPFFALNVMRVMAERLRTMNKAI